MTMILIGQAVAGDGGQLGDGHLEAAVADDREDQLVGPGELRADGRGQSEAHRAQAAGVDPQARLVEADELRGPHLVLADVGGDDGFAAREPVDFRHQVLRLDLAVGEGRLSADAAPSTRVICCHQARRAALSVSPSARASSLRGACSACASTRLTSPTMGTSGARFLPISAGSISTWITLACGAKAASRPVTRSSKRTPSAISRSASLMRHIGGVAAVHAGHADEVRMLGGQRAEPHQGIHRRRVEHLDELAQLRATRRRR